MSFEDTLGMEDFKNLPENEIREIVLIYWRKGLKPNLIAFLFSLPIGQVEGIIEGLQNEVSERIMKALGNDMERMFSFTDN